MWSVQNPKLVCEFFGHSGFFLCGKYFLTMCPSFSLDGRVEILTKTSCRHIRAWQDNPFLSNFVGGGLMDYDLGLGYVMVGNLKRKSV